MWRLEIKFLENSSYLVTYQKYPENHTFPGLFVCFYVHLSLSYQRTHSTSFPFEIFQNFALILAIFHLMMKTNRNHIFWTIYNKGSQYYWTIIILQYTYSKSKKPGDTDTNIYLETMYITMSANTFSLSVDINTLLLVGSYVTFGAVKFLRRNYPTVLRAPD